MTELDEISAYVASFSAPGSTSSLKRKRLVRRESSDNEDEPEKSSISPLLISPVPPIHDEEEEEKAEEAAEEAEEEDEEEAEEEDEEDEEDDMPELHDGDMSDVDDADVTDDGDGEKEEGEDTSEKPKKKRKTKAKKEKVVVDHQEDYRAALNDGTFCVAFTPLSREAANNQLFVVGVCWAKTVVISDLDLINLIAKQSMWPTQRSVETDGHCHAPAIVAQVLAKKNVSQDTARHHRETAGRNGTVEIVPFFVCICLPVALKAAISNPMMIYRLRVSAREFKICGQEAASAFISPNVLWTKQPPLIVTKEERLRYAFNPEAKHCIAGLPILQNCIAVLDFRQWSPESLPRKPPPLEFKVPVSWSEPEAQEDYCDGQDEIAELFGGAVWSTPERFVANDADALLYRPTITKKYFFKTPVQTKPAGTSLFGPKVLQTTAATAPIILYGPTYGDQPLARVLSCLKESGRLRVEQSCVSGVVSSKQLCRWIANPPTPTYFQQIKPVSISDKKPMRSAFPSTVAEQDAFMRTSLLVGSLMSERFWALAMHTTFADAFKFERANQTYAAFQFLLMSRKPADVIFNEPFDEIVFRDCIESIQRAQTTPTLTNIFNVIACREEQIPIDCWPRPSSEHLLDAVSHASFAWRLLREEAGKRSDSHYAVILERRDEQSALDDTSLSVRVVDNRTLYTTMSVDWSIRGFERIFQPSTGPFAKHGIDVIRVETLLDHNAALLSTYRRSSRAQKKLVVLCHTSATREKVCDLLGEDDNLIVTDPDNLHRLGGQIGKAHLCIAYAHEFQLIESEILLQRLTASLFKYDLAEGSLDNAVMKAHRGDEFVLGFSKIRRIFQTSVESGFCGESLTVIGLPLSPWSPYTSSNRKGPSLVDDLYFSASKQNVHPISSYPLRFSPEDVPFLRAFSGAGALLESMESLTSDFDELGSGVETIRIAGTRITCHVRQTIAYAKGFGIADSVILWPLAENPPDLGAKNVVMQAAPFECVGYTSTACRETQPNLVVFDDVPANCCIEREWKDATRSPAYENARTARKVALGIDVSDAVMLESDASMFDVNLVYNDLVPAPQKFQRLEENHAHARLVQSGFALSTILGLLFLQPAEISLYGSAAESIIQRLHAKYTVPRVQMTDQEREGGTTFNWFDTYAACAQSSLPFVLAPVVRGKLASAYA